MPRRCLGQELGVRPAADTSTSLRSFSFAVCSSRCADPSRSFGVFLSSFVFFFFRFFFRVPRCCSCALLVFFFFWSLAVVVADVNARGAGTLRASALSLSFRCFSQHTHTHTHTWLFCGGVCVCVWPERRSPAFGTGAWQCAAHDRRSGALAEKAVEEMGKRKTGSMIRPRALLSFCFSFFPPSCCLVGRCAVLARGRVPRLRARLPCFNGRTQGNGALLLSFCLLLGGGLSTSW